MKYLGKAELFGESDNDLTGIEYDSRRIRKGMLFIAVDGYKMNGNDFIPDAIKNGAAAILTDRDVKADVPGIVVPSVREAMADIAAGFYGYPGKEMIITGVTGTNGKSTSVYLIKKILEAAGKITGAINSLTYDTGDNKYKAERTTPESPDLQKYLSEMKNAECTHAVIEVSSHALVLHRVENIDFKIGLFTNFSRDHLDFHKTMEEYLQAKKLLLDKLQDDNKYVVLNVDVDEYAAFTDEVKCNLISFSCENRPADVTIKNAVLYPNRSVFTLITPDGSRQATIKLPGRYNLSNVAGAAAVGVAFSVDVDTIIRGLESANPVPGRFQPLDMGQPFSIILDFAHTPDAIERLCQSAREITHGRLLILFGCGGDRDRGKRPLMGQAASGNSDFAVITSDNPRTEDPLKIIEDVKPGMINQNYIAIPDRRKAVEEIINMAGENDMVLIAGKGAEDYQEIGTTRHPYEDRLEVASVLENMEYKKD